MKKLAALLLFLSASAASAQWGPLPLAWSSLSTGGAVPFGITGGACPANQFVVSIDTNGVPTCAALPAAGGAVSLQASYPGTPDTGNANISGTYGSTKTALHATLSNWGLSLENTTAALVGQQQEYTPGIRLLGAAWDVDGAVSNTNAWQILGKPINGNTTSIDLSFNASIAGGAYAQKALLGSDGLFSLGESGVSVGGIKLFNATSGSISIVPTTGALGTVTLTAPAVSGTILQSGTDVTLAQIVPASAANVLLGRGSAGGAGDLQEITLGSGMLMTSQVLSTTGINRTTTLDLFDDMISYNASGTSSCGNYNGYRTDQGAGSADGLSANGCSATDGTNHPGIVELTTSDSASGYASITLSNQSGIVIGANATWEALVRIPTLSVAASEEFTVKVGACDSATTGTSCADGAAFFYSDNINSGEWEARTYNSGGGGTTGTLDTNVAVVANTWYTLKWVMNGAASSVEFFINGSSVGTISTASAMPTVNSTAPIQFGIFKRLGTTARLMQLDFWHFTQPLTR